MMSASAANTLDAGDLVDDALGAVEAICREQLICSVVDASHQRHRQAARQFAAAPIR